MCGLEGLSTYKECDPYPVLLWFFNENEVVAFLQRGWPPPFSAAGWLQACELRTSRSPSPQAYLMNGEFGVPSSMDPEPYRVLPRYPRYLGRFLGGQVST